jgi:hypothetical protein
MPRIVAALISNNDIMALSQNVDDFSFGFVSPLQTNH